MKSNSESYLAQSNIAPPWFAVLLLRYFLPNALVEVLLGDLFEEYFDKAQINNRVANRWFWQQTFQTVSIYISKKLKSPSFFIKLNISVALTFFLISFVLIAWLSYADNIADYAPGFWQTLLTGQAHMALFEQAFWSSLLSYLTMIDSVNFLMHMPALLISIMSLFLLIYLDKKSPFTAAKMACWGYMLSVLPYIWSIVHINSNHFVATEIGPIIAIGLLNFLYMVLPVSYLVHMKVSHAN